MGYATSMMKETGRAMRLDINHRRSKILTLSKGTSASALSRKYVRTYKNLSPSPLTGPSSLEMSKTGLLTSLRCCFAFSASMSAMAILRQLSLRLNTRLPRPSGLNAMGGPYRHLPSPVSGRDVRPTPAPCSLATVSRSVRAASGSRHLNPAERSMPFSPTDFRRRR